ncbi:MAG: NERD domain-containing protein [Caldilineaceae bacterium]|nr:NERD domain-containing protein [Caldilineaceae bacterium]
MRVTLFPCGPAANESELKSFEYLKTRLLAEAPADEWVLLTNLAFSVTHQLQSDEIDIVAIGPTGVRVIEVKHWSPQWMDEHKNEMTDEADRVINKARKVGTRLRRAVPELNYVAGAILLTQEPSRVKRFSGQEVRGVTFHTLSDWKAAIGFDSPHLLTSQQVKQMANILQPRSAVAIEGSLRRLAGYGNLELQTPREQRFHRIYKGSHPARRDQVVLHLYDLSSEDDKKAEEKAKREFEALHRLQLYSWAPRLLDSFQDAPGYAGEMFFFTVVDPAAPNLEERSGDNTWTTHDRLAFARKTVRALTELHAAGASDAPIVHRNLTPRTILVKHDNSPILTGFEHSKLPSEMSIASSGLPSGSYPAIMAPEIQAMGLTVADYRSDVYALCACLQQLFEGRDDDLSLRTLNAFKDGLAAEPERRATLQHLEASLAELAGESLPPPPPPPARYWTEDQIIRFHNRDYRIVSRLGSGGVGITFKVVEIDHHTAEDLGTYVAKVVYSEEMGRRVLHAYRLVKPHLRHSGLSIIHEVSSEWHENEFVALMTWISGTPLAEYMDVFPLLAEDQQEISGEALALRWLRSVCEALHVLHRNGLIHGDISPRNLIVEGSNLVLTDYDFVQKIGQRVGAPGTAIYSSPAFQEQQPATPADDIYALAASFFHIIFEREPFRYGGDVEKKRGLNWESVPRDEYPILAGFLDRATHPEPLQRFTDVPEALAFLSQRVESKSEGTETQLKDEMQPEEKASRDDARFTSDTEQPLRERRVEWLLSVLQSYPGSRWGNRETRGLDTEFAAQTYVETPLEKTLLRDILDRRVRLVILCGNAGDGKTALLQHLATRLGLGQHQSSERILERAIPDGPLVRMNLDGSAAWRGRSADEILDEFLEPFQAGLPPDDIVHLLAINDGRLLEWIEGVEARNGSSATLLTESLYELLQQEATTKQSHIRFINLNQRSLVGGLSQDLTSIDTGFLDQLTDQLYGGDRAPEIWSPCLSCSAKDRCEVFQTARMLGPNTLPDLAVPEVRARARARLHDALQAVHLRGETHITMRELRAALVYILFSVHYCDDYHKGEVDNLLPYWDRTFAADSPVRQGEVLDEIARFDPALEAHPQIDRHLLSEPVMDSVKTAPHYPQLPLASARRRAYFEWTSDHLEQVAGDREALDLARGRHLRMFRDLPLADERTLYDICQQLCMGISRLEDLPPQALERPGVVPLRITPRTPTETAFWVEKPLDAFRLEADLPREVEGIERLHRQAHLVYRYRDGRTEERLRLGAELFHLLLELAEGYQLGDVSTDDTFAHLSIFVQRLVREDERELLAWNPMQDETIYKVSAKLCTTGGEPRQRMVIAPVGGEE